MNDVRDTFLEAMAEVQEVMREVMQEMTEPQKKNEVAQMWMSTPDKMKEKFKAERPEEYAALMEMLK